MKQEVHLVDLLSFTRDGEWGNGKPSSECSPALVIRGTDFSHVRAGNLETLPLRYIRTDVLARKAIRAGDTLIETAGGTKDQPTGRSVFIPNSIVLAAKHPLICASFARFLRPDPIRIDPQFLFWKLQDEYHSRRMFPYHVQHTGVARFQYTQFAESYPLVLPSLAYQRNIASTLGALDDKIELNRRMNETLEAMARAIFKDWFVDFGPTRAKMEGRAPYLASDIWSLFPDRLDDEGKPEGWCWGNLSDFADVTSGKRPLERFDNPSVDVSVPLYGGAGPMAFVTTPLYETPVLLTGRVGTLGKIHRVTEPCWPSDNTLVILSKNPDNYNFIYYSLLEVDIESLNRGSTQPLVTQSDIKKQRIIRPTLSLISEFMRLVEPNMDRLRNNTLESRTLSDIRDLLLPKLMSGEVRVADLASIV